MVKIITKMVHIIINDPYEKVSHGKMIHMKMCNRVFESLR